jgi:hypothetical protein
VLYDKNWDVRTFKDYLARYTGGGRIPESNFVAFDPNEDPTQQQQEATTQMARMKANGVNNIINVGNVTYNAVVTKAAAQQNYHPEWTITGWAVSDTAVGGQLNDQSEWAHAFGFGNVQPLPDDPAKREYYSLFAWEYGREASLGAINGEMYLLAKDIFTALQLAGPHLTPATFRQGMFASAPKGGAFCGCVTVNSMAFGRVLPAYPGEKYFSEADFTEKWFDTEHPGTDEIGLTAPGRMMWINGGRRYLPGHFPTGQPDMFDPATAIATKDDVPANERAPDYPRPKR